MFPTSLSTLKLKYNLYYNLCIITINLLARQIHLDNEEKKNFLRECAEYTVTIIYTLQDHYTGD